MKTLEEEDESLWRTGLDVCVCVCVCGDAALAPEGELRWRACGLGERLGLGLSTRVQEECLAH